MPGFTCCKTGHFVCGLPLIFPALRFICIHQLIQCFQLRVGLLFDVYAECFEQGRIAPQGYGEIHFITGEITVDPEAVAVEFPG